MQQSEDWLAKQCHPQVAETCRRELARYSRLSAACDALESFLGVRPRDDDDVFGVLSQRRRELADRLAVANLEARLQTLDEGMYLAIPYFSFCSDKQPLWLVNRTDRELVYIGRRLYAFAADDEGVVDYATSSSAFADGIATSARIAPGQQLKIDDYSMSFDGDFVGSHRIVVMQDNEQFDVRASVGKLGGHLWDEDPPGIHLLQRLT